MHHPFSKLLRPEAQDFINTNKNADLQKILLKTSPFSDVTIQELVQQIKGLQVAEKKFSFLLKENIVFPPGLNLEQASSEPTGNYKKNLIKGKTFADLTCGFGIDAWFLSQNFSDTTLIEQNTDLIKIVAHNWKVLGKKATFLNQKLEDFLNQNKDKFDAIYLDPARRDEQKNKVFLLQDLSPNLLEIQEQLMRISETVMVKLSPLVDLKYLVSVVHHLSEIHIVAVKNDVKELLLIINHSEKEVLCRCVNLESDHHDFEFYFGDEEHVTPAFSQPLKYLYIANNAVLKSGAFNLISEEFNLKKLHQNTQLFTSEDLVKDFPGRILEIRPIEPKKIKKGSQFNIISKNYPLKPDEIKTKYGIKDGGKNYLIFTQSISGKVVLEGQIYN